MRRSSGAVCARDINFILLLCAFTFDLSKHSHDTKFIADDERWDVRRRPKRYGTRNEAFRLCTKCVLTVTNKDGWAWQSLMGAACSCNFLH